jgi:hypothetical protein
MRPCNPQPPGGNAARAHRYAAVVPSIDPAMLPAAAASSGCPCRGFGGSCTSYHSAGVSQRDCRRLLEQPDCLQVTFPAKGWLQVATGNEPPGSLDGSKAERTSIGRAVRNLISGFHRDILSGTSRKGRSFVRVPSLGKRSLHLQEYQVRDSVVNSKVLENKRLAGMGAMGNRPYIEANCCRLQRTTSEGNGAPGAEHKSGFGLHLDSGDYLLAGAKTVSV